MKISPMQVVSAAVMPTAGVAYILAAASGNMFATGSDLTNRPATPQIMLVSCPDPIYPPYGADCERLPPYHADPPTFVPPKFDLPPEEPPPDLWRSLLPWIEHGPK